MDNTSSVDRDDGRSRDRDPGTVSPPALSLPKGGGAIRGMGEKFAANPVTGTASMTIPIFASPGRSGFGPQLALSYDSGAGNGPFGFGWNLSVPAITRKTDKGLPRYQDAAASDLFLLSGAEDLVPVLTEDHGAWQTPSVTREIHGRSYRIEFYRPRIEGLFARIERWTNTQDTADVFWRSISKDNITTWYGKTAESRIFDPTDPTRIFSWLICESHDDKGNAIAYGYKAEDSQGISTATLNERNRSELTRSANRYLKRIRYGNRGPYFPDLTAGEPLPLPTEWLFELVFDYGEHDADNPLPNVEVNPWDLRNDPFSTYRAGFEVRTYRLCQRALMFHHFPEPDVGANCLVRSTDFTYSYEIDPAHAQNSIFSFLLSASQSGYRRTTDGHTIRRALPPLTFEYSQPIIRDEIRNIDPQSLENLPIGLDGGQYQWLDLDGEGLSGILTQQAGAYYFKPNLSPAPASGTNLAAGVRFGPTAPVAKQPSVAAAGDARQQWLDLAGDGQVDLVDLDGPTPGFYERRHEADWETLKPFESLPQLDWSNPNLRFVDLTGDGHADILITEDEAFCWYASLAEVGFAPPERLRQALDEEQGPRLVFADGTQSIYLSDISGDGLMDLVRIRNGEVCYWPNLGYGRFGAKVSMDNAPWLDHPDQFDQERVRMADIDGSGTTDIIYLAGDGVRLYFNQSGNSLSPGQRLAAFPAINDVASIQVADLMGNGTACLVWSSPLAGDAASPMRYVDLMGGQKPHLLIKSVNNLGAETHVQYAPSTKFYLADQLAGKPWITRIPFPVHVVERVEILDRISGNRFVTRYAYHHGYFDGVEREFRGFGMVEQWDTEEMAALSATEILSPSTNIDPVSHVPPVLTKTWFHTGVYVGREHVSNFFAGLLDAEDIGEYYRETELNDEQLNDEQARSLLLPDTLLPQGLSGEEEREACRALKGAMLRQEVYALDGTDKEPHPYAVTEQNFTVRMLQPRAGNRHAVFFTHPREALSYHYERNPSDPRIGHTLTLEVDDFGNVRKAAAIAYGRRVPDAALSPADQAQQTQIFSTCTDSGFTHPVEQDDHYRAPLPSEVRTYELTGLELTGAAVRFGFEKVLGDLDTAVTIPYEQQADSAQLQKRLIEHLRTQYRPNDLGSSVGDASALLPVGTLESIAVPGESYKLAFTPSLVEQRFGGRVTADMLGSEGGYVDIEGDGNQWLPSGRAFLSPNAGDTPEQELAYARAHFFIPRRFVDPFGNEATATVDDYDLLGTETRDPLGNTVSAVNDYRTLQPRLVTDPNGNQSEVAFDALGMVAGTAIMGKPDEGLGDTLEGFEVDLSEAEILDHLANPLADPHAILQGATTRLVYDLSGYARTQSDAQPQGAVAYALTRETHQSDLEFGELTKVQHSFSYSDGFGREIQKKIQAEPGPLNDGGPDVGPRWVGSGWTVFNNKGKPVRQFEPFFTGTHRFEFDIRRGVSPILCYDPVQRVVATLNPNHTWQKVVFDPWRQETWDVNDTVLITDPAEDVDVGGFFARLPTDDYLPTWHGQRIDGALGAHEQEAAIKTAVHADTPAVAHMDSLGRTFLAVAHNTLKRSDSPEEEPPIEAFQHTRVVFDIEGNQREVIDALDRIVMRYDYDMLGNQVHSASMEAGERWMLNDVAGQPIRAWDSRGHAFRTEYDALRRPVGKFVSGGDAEESDPRVLGREVMFEKIEYGEDLADDTALNLRTRVWKVYDTAGVVTSEEYDFKGNLLRGSRQLASDYKAVPDWSAAVPLDVEIYTSSTTYDALNRPVTSTSPDGSVMRPAYNEANLLERIDANLRGETRNGEPVWTPFVTDIDYNAKGQRERIDYGNGVSTEYIYDPLTFRLTRLFTRRDAVAFPDDCPPNPPADWPGCAVQNLHYTYDPVGNITYIRDDAQQTIFFRNRRVEPSNDYLYDATYQLIEATGREHLGQIGGVPNAPTAPDAFNGFHTGLLHPGDGKAMGTYLESYVYDVVGNFLSMQHRGTDPSHPGWTRSYAYEEPSLIEPGKVSNRLSSTQVGTGGVERYPYDAHGSMVAMPHLPVMQWTFLDQLRASSKQVFNGGTPETTSYVYDAAGQRVRKVTERQAAEGETPRRMKERIYLGGFEVYREFGGDGVEVALERETLHVMDDQQRIALVETRTLGEDGSPAQLIRYQLGNHLGSASLELDEAGGIISYEEYCPYGSTSSQAMDASIKAAAKRYRYTGMERDEETGLAYHGARYYAAWLGRWTRPDPAGLIDGTNRYILVRNDPLGGRDPSGTQEEPTITQLTFEQRPWGSIREKVRQMPEDTASQRIKKVAWLGLSNLGVGADFILTGVSNPTKVAKAWWKTNPVGMSVEALSRYANEGTLPSREETDPIGWEYLSKAMMPVVVVGQAAMLPSNAGELTYHVTFGQPNPVMNEIGLASPTLEGQFVDTLASANSAIVVASVAAGAGPRVATTPKPAPVPTRQPTTVEPLANHLGTMDAGVKAGEAVNAVKSRISETANSFAKAKQTQAGRAWQKHTPTKVAGKRVDSPLQKLDLPAERNAAGYDLVNQILNHPDVNITVSPRRTSAWVPTTRGTQGVQGVQVSAEGSIGFLEPPKLP